MKDIKRSANLKNFFGFLIFAAIIIACIANKDDKSEPSNAYEAAPTENVSANERMEEAYASEQSEDLSVEHEQSISDAYAADTPAEELAIEESDFDSEETTADTPGEDSGASLE